MLAIRRLNESKAILIAQQPTIKQVVVCQVKQVYALLAKEAMLSGGLTRRMSVRRTLGAWVMPLRDGKGMVGLA